MGNGLAEVHVHFTGSPAARVCCLHGPDISVNCPTYRRKLVFRLVPAACLLHVSFAGVCLGQFAVGGVFVDAEGVVRSATRETDIESRLPEPAANDDVSKSSSRRMISLARLERALEKTEGRPSAIQRALAGLHRIDGVYLLADDIVLAGAAEGWATRANGEVVAVTAKRPLVEFEDLVVAFRTAFSEEEMPAAFGCSIDPTREGLQRVEALNRRMRTTKPADAGAVALGMQRAMGMQAVRVFGVSADSPFALGLVAADVKLKRIAMGHESTGVAEVPSYLALAGRSRVAPRGLLQNRFWFVAHYDAIRTSKDGRAFELVGGGLWLLAGPPGEARDAKALAAPGSSAGRFTGAFNEHVDELISKHTEFAGLQNRIALAVVAELAVRPHLDNAVAEQPKQGEREAWIPERLIDPRRTSVASITVPKFVPSLAGVQRARGGRALVHVSGGVSVDPVTIVDDAPRVEWQADVPLLPADPTIWWWDAQASPKPSSRQR